MFVVLLVGTVAHFFSVDGYPCRPVFYSALSFLFNLRKGSVLEQGKFLTLLRNLANLCFLLLLFFRLTYLPYIKRFERFELLQIEFGMPAVTHMLFHTILRLEFVLAVYAVPTFDLLADILQQSIEVDAFLSERREAMCFFEVIFGASLGAERTQLSEFFVIDELEFRHG